MNTLAHGAEALARERAQDSRLVYSSQDKAAFAVNVNPVMFPANAMRW